jgi:hypothetical protein
MTIHDIDKKMIFEAASVYASDEDGDVQLMQRIIHQSSEPKATTINEAMFRPLIVRGLRLGDFALFASVADNNGVAEIPYLVTDYANEDTATIAAYELIRKSPLEYVTRHLAKSLQYINPPELAQFQINELMGYIDERFPRG